MTAQDILKQYFGYDSFRPGQAELVRAILSGWDTLGIMPTGAGKSICYQVPAMLFPGLTLVISPLISLMKDQVGALVEAGVPAACINSAMSAEEFRAALDPRCSGAARRTAGSASPAEVRKMLEADAGRLAALRAEREAEEARVAKALEDLDEAFRKLL